MGRWRRCDNNELHNLHASPNVIRIFKSRGMRLTGHVTRMGEMRNAYEILSGKPEEERRLRKPRNRWQDNIRMDVKGIGWEGVGWMHLAQNRDQ
jgi:hypothetical protein